MANDMDRIRELLTYSLGDEKHDPSTHSTLDVLWVLYDRVLCYDPQRPRWEGRDRFVLSKGHGCQVCRSVESNSIVLIEPYYEGALVPDICAAMGDTPVRIETIGVPHRILSRYGQPWEHDTELGLTAEGIKERIEEIINR